MRLKKEQLLRLLDKCKSNPFLAYGYVRQLEEIEKEEQEESK